MNLGDINVMSFVKLDIKRIDMFTGEKDALVSLGDIGDEH